jgi:hypothetical protein
LESRKLQILTEPEGLCLSGKWPIANVRQRTAGNFAPLCQIKKSAK